VSRRQRLAPEQHLIDQVADYNQSGGNANTGLQRSAGLQPSHRLDQLQPRTYRPLGIVLMGVWVTEVHEHAIAHVLRHEPTEALHRLGDTLLIGGDDLAQVLRVDAGRERCRTYKVREHHCDLAALSSFLGLGFNLWAAGLWCCGNCPGHLGDGSEHYSPMPEQDAYIFQVLISYMGERRESKPVLSKALRVLGHAELL
jgi:hypothetical protein